MGVRTYRLCDEINGLSFGQICGNLVLRFWGRWELGAKLNDDRIFHGKYKMAIILYPAKQNAASPYKLTFDP